LSNKQILLQYAQKLGLPLEVRSDDSFSIVINKKAEYSVIEDHLVPSRFETWNYKTKGEIGRSFTRSRNLESVKRTLRLWRRKLEAQTETGI